MKYSLLLMIVSIVIISISCSEQKDICMKIMPDNGWSQGEPTPTSEECEELITSAFGSVEEFEKLEEIEQQKEIEVQKSSYTIDAANLIWLESRIELSSRFKNKGETKSKSNPMVAAMSMDDVVDSILTYTRNVSDQKNIFTKKRGCGRKKSKKKIELAIDTVSLVYLKRAVQEYELPDLGKCLRIVLEYVMEDEGVETSIFS